MKITADWQDFIRKTLKREHHHGFDFVSDKPFAVCVCGAVEPNRINYKNPGLSPAIAVFDELLGGEE
jgi:hypothetical protein